MPGSSNNSSFIPKRGTTKHTRKVRKGGIYVLSILSSVALFTSLAASVGVYFYSSVVAQELDAEISAMSDAVSNFKEADLRRVKDFDLRLDQAQQRLDNTVSTASIFAAIENATAETVRFDSFLLQRNEDENFIVEADIFTDSFDSTIFQRGIFSDDSVVERIEIENVTLEQGVQSERENFGSTPINQVSENGVSFNAFLSIPVLAVPYIPDLPEEIAPITDSQINDLEESVGENGDSGESVDDGSVSEEVNQPAS